LLVLWRVTDRCNLGCGFCAYDRTLSGQRTDADVAMIRRFGAVLAEYQRTVGEGVLVSWIGGEPFLFPQLSDLTAYFAEQLGLRISATTNGTTLASAVVRQHILENYSELTISVDGIGLVHDDLRGWQDGYRTLHKSVTQLVEAKVQQKRGLRLRANVLLMRQTISGFENLCLQLARWGFNEITFNQLGGRDRPDFFPAHRLLPEDAYWLIRNVPRIRARLAAHNVKLNGADHYLKRIMFSSRNEKLPVSNCSPGQQFLFIDETGNVSPCSFTTKDYGVKLSDFGSVDTLLELPGRFAALQKRSTLAACQDCHSTQVFAKFAA